MSSSLNLNALLERLEADSSMEKAASEVVAPAVADEFAEVLNKKASQDLTKVAHEQGELLAKQLLEKFANEIQVNDAVNQASDDKKIVATSEGTIEDTLQGTVEQALENGATTDDRVDSLVDAGKGEPAGEQISAGDNQLINKEATVDNTKMAQYIMQKLAEEGVVTGNIMQQHDAQLQAEDDAKVLPLPGAEGTINNILEAVVARAEAQGAGSDDLVNGEGAQQRENDEVEKAAAVSALVAEGLDFDSAITLVKQAEQELSVEAFEQEKQAALNTLVEAGIDFDSAVDMIKQAEEDLEKEAGIGSALKAGVSAVKSYGKSIAESGKVAGGLAKNLVKGKNSHGVVMDRKSMVKALAGNKAVRTGAGVAAAGAAGVALSREKKAALDTLTAEGIDFEDAVALIKQAEQDIYGE